MNLGFAIADIIACTRLALELYPIVCQQTRGEDTPELEEMTAELHTLTEVTYQSPDCRLRSNC